MAASPDPVHPSNEAPAYASNISLTLSLKGQTVQTYEFNRESISVGRDPLCEIYVDNPGVSRQHFRITRGEQGDYRVADQGSSNGTYLNDRPIQVASLRDGDTIQFSKYSLLVGLEELVGALEGDRALRLASPPPSEEQLAYSSALIRQQAEQLQGVLRSPPVPE